jgi:hypothetical protein
VKTEKKLIATSILALLIGVSSVVPLLFLMSGTAKADTGSEPWFSIDVPYAYYVTSNGALNYTGHQVPSGIELNETNSVSEQHIIVLNLTLNANVKNEFADARIEYYQINVTTDKGPVENMYWQVGTNNNSSFKDFHFMRDDWFNTDAFDPLYSGGGGLIIPNWTAGFSVLWPESGSGTGTLSGSSTSKVVSALREAETVFISIQRVGWVTFAGNSTVVTLAHNEIVCQVQLEKFGDGFLYNNLVPEDELSTIDLMRPVPFEDLFP